MAQMVDLAAAWDARVLRLTSKMPRRLASVLSWLRKPAHRPIRFIAAALFILGGLFSILPILGLWMLPLGFGLLAEDVPGLKPPLERAARWLVGQWRHLVEVRRKLRR
jgi:hypothetical protein